MFFLFKHGSKQKQHTQDAKQDKIAECIVIRFLMVQSKASKILQDKFEMLSITVKRVVVVAFCVISFSSCVFLIVKAFSTYTDKAFSITTISLPKQAVSALGKSQASNSLVKAELEKIISFRRYLDSLATTEAGKRLLNRILINRPGLVDSLMVLEKMYQLQSPNK